jgi:hypothetical protein
MVTVRTCSLLVFGALVVACSGSSPAVPQAGANVTVLPGTNTSAQCPVVGEDSDWNLGGANLSPVQNGGSQGGAPVSVTCTVHQTGSNYSVSGAVDLNGAGSFTILGTIDTTNGAPQTSQNVTGSFVLPNGLGDWTETTCNVTFPDSYMGVAPGRIWAEMDCPTMQDSGNNTQCDGNVTFRLENCNE